MRYTYSQFIELFHSLKHQVGELMKVDAKALSITENFKKFKEGRLPKKHVIRRHAGDSPGRASQQSSAMLERRRTDLQEWLDEGVRLRDVLLSDISNREEKELAEHGDELDRKWREEAKRLKNIRILRRDWQREEAKKGAGFKCDNMDPDQSGEYQKGSDTGWVHVFLPKQPPSAAVAFGDESCVQSMGQTRPKSVAPGFTGAAGSFDVFESGELSGSSFPPWTPPTGVGGVLDIAMKRIEKLEEEQRSRSISPVSNCRRKPTDYSGRQRQKKAAKALHGGSSPKPALPLTKSPSLGKLAFSSVQLDDVEGEMLSKRWSIVWEELSASASSSASGESSVSVNWNPLVDEGRFLCGHQNCCQLRYAAVDKFQLLLHWINAHGMAPPELSDPKREFVILLHDFLGFGVTCSRTEKRATLMSSWRKRKRWLQLHRRTYIERQEREKLEQELARNEEEAGGEDKQCEARKSPKGCGEQEKASYSRSHASGVQARAISIRPKSESPALWPKANGADATVNAEGKTSWRFPTFDPSNTEDAEAAAAAAAVADTETEATIVRLEQQQRQSRQASRWEEEKQAPKKEGGGSYGAFTAAARTPQSTIDQRQGREVGAFDFDSDESEDDVESTTNIGRACQTSMQGSEASRKPTPKKVDEDLVKLGDLLLLPKSDDDSDTQPDGGGGDSYSIEELKIMQSETFGEQTGELPGEPVEEQAEMQQGGKTTAKKVDKDLISPTYPVTKVIVVAVTR
jgi:hypothetical protein